MMAVTICSDFGAQKVKLATVSPSICHEVMGVQDKLPLLHHSRSKDLREIFQYLANQYPFLIPKRPLIFSTRFALCVALLEWHIQVPRAHYLRQMFQISPRALTWCSMCVCLVAQSCLTLCDTMDYGPPGSSVHGDSPGKNTTVGCHALLQGIFPTQAQNPAILHYKWILYYLSHQGSPYSIGMVIRPKLK